MLMDFSSVRNKKVVVKCDCCIVQPNHGNMFPKIKGDYIRKPMKNQLLEGC